MRELLALGHKGPQIIQILLVQHSISILPSTLTCKRQVWGLRQNEIPKPVVSELLPPIRITVTIHTVKRYLSRLDLRLNGDDLANGKVTLGKVYGAIDHIQKFLLDNNTGYRRVKTLLTRNYNIRIPRQVVYELLKGVNPESVAGRLKQTCKQQGFHVCGPNHVWAIDGHDKLKPFGSTVYGFIDALSRKILGLFVNVTNNDPKHISVYYLKLVLQLGRIPLKVTTNMVQRPAM
ncbi:hypothetical protein PSTG_06377 [Puccinia striiformis f. sp. tritici PST-78]|uniref:Integrase core domain-containing protein n=1 Tax=Puccinia striiformis f. sp. tritici PST-78 TaxID=1165861 RepID=A0A0L0VME8_9BASI|nr:hypothetical protein PSTG_06377 [Puccinia striiformis f. sp. tritici PST-78]